MNLKHEGFWTRFVHYLNTTSITLDGLDTKAGIPHTDVSLTFKTALKEVPSFRRQLREKLATRLGELRQQVHEFFELGRKKIQISNPRSVVFIFDQLEQLRDPIGNDGRVAESVTTLLANHRADLRVPLLHVVFTVPPWLKFKLPQVSDVRMLYNVRL